MRKAPSSSLEKSDEMLREERGRYKMEDTFLVFRILKLRDETLYRIVENIKASIQESINEAKNTDERWIITMDTIAPYSSVYFENTSRDILQNDKMADAYVVATERLKGLRRLLKNDEPAKDALEDTVKIKAPR